jgi:hypothetical protein
MTKSRDKILQVYASFRIPLLEEQERRKLLNLSRELLQKIFSLDRRVRYVAILDSRGAHLEGGMRPGTLSLNPEDEESKLFRQATVARGMSEMWSRYFGPLEFSIICHEKLTVLLFPFGENVLLVTTEPDVPISITREIHKIVQTQKPKSQSI